MIKQERSTSITLLSKNEVGMIHGGHDIDAADVIKDIETAVKLGEQAEAVLNKTGVFDKISKLGIKP